MRLRRRWVCESRLLRVLEHAGEWDCEERGGLLLWAAETLRPPGRLPGRRMLEPRFGIVGIERASGA